MGATLRAVLVRTTPVSWLAAITLAAIYAADPDPQFLGFVITGTGLAAAGSICGAIEATARASTAMLIRELAEVTRPRSGELRPLLRRAR
jgi:hypothetical protein